MQSISSSYQHYPLSIPWSEIKDKILYCILPSCKFLQIGCHLVMLSKSSPYLQGGPRIYGRYVSKQNLHYTAKKGLERMVSKFQSFFFHFIYQYTNITHCFLIKEMFEEVESPGF